MFAIKIPFAVDKKTKEPTDWIYITSTDGGDFEVKLFATREEAEEHARAWKQYKVVEYNG